jgi:hypothetical protein
MLSLQKKFLFVHIPKTGGNSLQNILKDYSEDRLVGHTPDENGILQRFQVRNEQYDLGKHATLSQYKEVLAEELFSSLYKFAVIRNPWDRMISYYFSPHRGVQVWNRYSFLELVNEVQPAQHYTCSKRQHRLLQILENICKEAGLRFSFARKRIDTELDFLIRFEDLDKGFQEVCERLAIPHIPLPRANRSRHEHYSVYYDKETREAVGQKFRAEIITGKYRFEAEV